MGIKISESLRTSLPEKTFENACTLVQYLYVEDGSLPSVSVDKDHGLSIRYQSDAQCLDIHVYENGYKLHLDANENKIVMDYSLDKIYALVNYTKLFYNPRKDKLCLFTGAFNPPTIAHYHMIESAMNVHDFDYIVFAVSSQEFIDKKQRKSGGWAYNESQRLQMLTEMTHDCKNVLIFGPERGYTYDVLCDVQKQYNPKELYFALGSDKLKQIGKWGHHDALLAEFCFYVLQREDSISYIKSMCDTLFSKTKYVIGTDNEEYKSISATDVRNKIDNNLDYRDLVFPGVYNRLQEYKHL